MHKAITLAGSALSTLQGAVHDSDSHAAIQRWASLAQQDTGYAVTLTAPLNLDIDNLYAGHRSHSSHSSHRSHSSHYSGSGGSYRYTAPAPRVAPRPVAPTYPSPSPVTPNSLRPSSSTPVDPNYYSTPAQPATSTPRPSTDQLTLMIMRVQAALFSRGYDPGAIDGVMGAKTRSALIYFQTAQGLTATGTMTTETLNALGVRVSP
jgi:His-Xaa-Ser repeat protein HxsA